MGGRLRTIRAFTTSRRYQRGESFQGAGSIQRKIKRSLDTIHEERTAAKYWKPGMHTVVVLGVQQASRDIRLCMLQPVGARPKFLPGQWLDVHIPKVPQVGGFSITSTPKDLEKIEPYLGLAVQRSRDSQPAQWLFQRKHKVLGQILNIKVGGSFVWPPPGVDTSQIQKLVLVAGGMGINPLMSIITHLITDSDYQGHIELLYSSRRGTSGKVSSILFLKQIHKLFEKDYPHRRHHYTVFCTDVIDRDPNWKPGVGLERPRATRWISNNDIIFLGEHQSFEPRRFETRDLEAALGPEAERQKVVAYVCGPPPMTDWAVDILRRCEGMEEKRVLCERWW